MAEISRTVLCQYRVLPEREGAFRKLCSEHDEVVRRLGLVTDEPTQFYRGSDGEGRPFYVQIFTWSSDEAVEQAHQHPEVRKVWERLDPCCEARGSNPGMEFPHVEAIPI